LLTHGAVGCHHGIHRTFGECAGEIMGQSAAAGQLSAGDVMLRDHGGHGPDPIFAACLSLLHVIPPDAAPI